MAHKLLFVDHASALGGAEHSLLLILGHLSRARWQPHLVCSAGLLAEKAVALGIPCHNVAMPRLRRSPRFLLDWLVGTHAIARLARQTGAAFIYANTVRAAWYGALAARWAGTPFIWHMRDFWLGESRPRYPFPDQWGKGLLCTAACRIITNSQAVAGHLPCRRKVTVVYNGIEIKRFDPATDGQSFRQQYGIPADAPLTGMVGRLRPWKGQECFLRAMVQVQAEVSEAWFAIVGGAIFDAFDNYPDRLRMLAADLGIAKRVVFTGHLEDVRPALAAFDVFVHPGDPEPFGLVNVEAMAMQKPVVAFAHGALPEIVIDGESGLLIPLQDERALAGAVVTLLRDPVRRKAMGRAARARAAANFTAEQMVAGVEAVLQDVVG